MALSQVPPSRKAKVEPDPCKPAKQPAAKFRETADLFGSAAAGDGGEQDHDDVGFEEIELPKPQELQEEVWEFLGSQHAPNAASQNSSYPGSGPGLSRFLS